jgi:hypothetical protein
MMSRINYYPKKVYTSNGELSFYAVKSYSKHALNSEFDIETNLEGYNIDISLFKKRYNNEKGLIHANFAPQIKFYGTLIEFDFEHLSEKESTVILSGVLTILGFKKQKSFLGNIKRIDNMIYISSNFILEIEEYSFEKVFHCTSLNTSKSIRIELELQLK